MSRANTTELVGAVALVRNTPSKVILSDKLWRIKFSKNSKLLPEYALLALRQAETRRIIGDLATGSSGSMQNISMEKAATIPIPIPPIAEQKRIASIAQKCDRRRRTRRYTQQLSDSYLRSVFLEMFGDPVINSKNFDQVLIQEVADIIVPTRDKPKRFCGRVPWITLPDLDSLFISNAKNLLTHEDAAEVSNRLMPANTVLLSCAGSLGQIAIATQEVYANQQFYGLVAKPKLIVPTFLAFALKALGEEFFFNLAGVSTIGFFSKDKALNIKVLLPPLSLQEKFAQIIQRFERLRTQQREAERQAEHLFQTVLHRAFRGEI